MQRQHARLTRAVIGQRCGRHVACHACNADNVTLLRRDHVRQEGLDGVEVRDKVDVEQLAQLVGLGVEDGVHVGDAGVVDEDGGRAEKGADGGGDFVHGGGGGDVGFEEVDVLDWVSLLVVEMCCEVAGMLPSSVGSDMSMLATLIPLAARPLHVNAPIPI